MEVEQKVRGKSGGRVDGSVARKYSIREKSQPVIFGSDEFSEILKYGTVNAFYSAIAGRMTGRGIYIGNVEGGTDSLKDFVGEFGAQVGMERFRSTVTADPCSDYSFSHRRGILGWERVNFDKTRECVDHNQGIFVAIGGDR